MLILFNKAISVACFARRCWQFFLLPHFSQSIDADTNVSAAHSLKLQTKIGWDLLWDGNPRHSLHGESFVSFFCSLLSMSPRSAAAVRDTSPLCGWRCPCGDTSPALESLPAAAVGAGALLASFPGQCKPLASLLSTQARVGTANSLLNEGFGINALNLRPGLQSPGFLVTLSLFHCDLQRFSSSLTFILSLLTYTVAWKSWILFGLLRSCLNLP